MKSPGNVQGLVAIDCEGPLTKNDNALELSSHFIPDGERLFTQLSRYDDILADMVKRPGYRAGNTLKLICPFLRAFGVKNQDVLDFSSKHILIMSGADSLLKWMDRTGRGFIISTSYNPYIQALCDIVGFPFQNTYSTKLDLDVLDPSEEECRKVREMADRILSLPALEWGSDVNGVEALPGDVKGAFLRMDEMMTHELEMSYLGGYLKNVEPVGGEEKAKAVRKSCEKTGQDLSHVIYIGDSITDVEAFQLVRENGGMTVAFNANRYAVAVAESACLSNHSDILAILCQVFWEKGRQGIQALIEGWQMGESHIKRLISGLLLADALLKKEKKHRSSLQWITEENRASLISQSEAFRGQVRGEEIGRLG